MAMLYKCLIEGCMAVWGTSEPGVAGYSHGYCSRHSKQVLASKFKKQQREEGNPDCCGEAKGFCERNWCTFHPICLKDEISLEDLSELQQRLGKRNGGRVHYC